MDLLGGFFRLLRVKEMQLRSMSHNSGQGSPVTRQTLIVSSILVCLLVGLPRHSTAGVVGYSSGSFTVHFDSGFGGSLLDGPHTITVDNLAANTILETTYNKTFVSGNNVAHTYAGGWHFWNSNIVLAGMADGTGVSQFAPDGGNTAAVLTLDYEGTFDIEGPWGPLFAYYKLPLHLWVTDEGFAGVNFSGQMEGFAVSSADAIAKQRIFGISFSDGALLDQPGDVYPTLYDSITLAGFPDPSTLGPTPGGEEYDGFIAELSGTLEFFAKNDHGEAGILFMNDGFPTGAPGPGDIPEPSTFALAALGFLFLLKRWRRRA